MKTLGDYATACGPYLTRMVGDSSQPIARVTGDSRRVQAGDLFVAVQGSLSDGREYVAAALEQGAVAIVLRGACPGECAVPVLQVSDDYAALGRLAECAAGYPARRLRLAGVTGTNGKTTSAYLLRDIMRQAELRLGMLGTIAFEIAGESREASHTTPDALALQGLFAEMAAGDCSHAILEVSSHALAQRRLGTAPFEAAAFTNLTRDHGDYHPTMEIYFEAKARLFRENLKAGGTAVVNVDDSWGRRLADELRAEGRVRILTFGMTPGADIRAELSELGLTTTTFKLATPWGELMLTSPLTGQHNISNVMTACGLALSLGISPDIIREAIEGFAGVPGRLQRLDGAGGVSVFVDYAHTPDALANVLLALQPFRTGRLLVVFGCGGDRDRRKRPEMAAEVAAHADSIYVTSDNPRTEDEEQILDDVVAGIPPGTPYRRIADRRQAIVQAVAEAREGDILLIAGKGHEPYQEIDGVRYPFSDFAVAGEALASAGHHPSEES